jgi:predicted dehydrogenase
LNFKKFVENKDDSSKTLLKFNVFRTEADPGLKILSNSWRTGSAKNGGGILTDTAVHYFYLFSWMFEKL